MRPFTPRQKDNLAAWMVARNDGEHYGKLVVYRFPRQSLVFGPTQIVNRINQDTEVARQISLWDQRGSEVIRGELLVIPIEESLIYVQPLVPARRGRPDPRAQARDRRATRTGWRWTRRSRRRSRGCSAASGRRAAPPTAIADADPATGAPATATPARDGGSRRGRRERRAAAARTRSLRPRDRRAAGRRLGDLRRRDPRLGEVLRRLTPSAAPRP